MNVMDLREERSSDKLKYREDVDDTVETGYAHKRSWRNMRFLLAGWQLLIRGVTRVNSQDRRQDAVHRASCLCAPLSNRPDDSLLVHERYGFAEFEDE
jgi:hypothetical protein